VHSEFGVLEQDFKKNLQILFKLIVMCSSQTLGLHCRW